MIIQKIILLCFAYFQIANTILSTDLCNRKIQCNQMPYIHMCERSKCAKSVKTCEEFNMISRNFNTRLFTTNIRIAGLTDIFQASSRNEEKKFEAFKKGIKDCPSKVIEINWRSEFVCMKRKKCYEQTNHKSSKAQVSFKKIECPCDGFYSYECSKDYCAQGKHACHLMHKKKSKQNSTFLSSIKRCGFWSLRK